jgi:hypothetical protein
MHSSNSGLLNYKHIILATIAPQSSSKRRSSSSSSSKRRRRSRARGQSAAAAAAAARGRGGGAARGREALFKISQLAFVQIANISFCIPSFSIIQKHTHFPAFPATDDSTSIRNSPNSQPFSSHNICMHPAIDTREYPYFELSALTFVLNID